MIQSLPQETKFFSLHYSASIRIWHWLTAVFILGSIVTVLFAENLFDDLERKGPPPGQQQEQVEQREEGGEERIDFAKLDPETRAAFRYRHKIWEVHKYIGLGLVFLLLSRIVIEVRKDKEGRLITRLNRAMRMPASGVAKKNEKLHYLLSKWGYVVFYVLLLLMACTGLIMVFEDAPALKSLQDPAREVHETLQYLMYGYILAHLAGVIYADLKNQKGIVSAMINGGS